MRQRVRDARPKAVDFLPGTPEENLNFFRTRVARFGARYLVRFAAPFLGRWTCTQSVDGTVTHRGAWRHALDFQVMGTDGRVFTGDGVRVGDYLCYRLPVTAPADGIVAKVVDGVADNAVGEMNLEENWGNLVIVYHAPALYSLLCHLAPGTLTVREGQPVRRGETLALCGSSGRSPTPHLHFQLQATARVGAPTLPLELHDVIVGEEPHERMCPVRVPEEGTTVRRVQPEPSLARRLRFEYGEILHLERDGRVEEVVADIDLHGTLLLRSRTYRATLYYEHTDDGFTVWDALGDPRSSLHLLQTALSRMPFDHASGLRFTDHLPTRPFLPWWVRPLADVVAPFQPSTGVEMEYAIERAGAELRVRGHSPRIRHHGAPAIVTEAHLSTRGLQAFEVSVRGRTERVTRRWEAGEVAGSASPAAARALPGGAG